MQTWKCVIADDEPIARDIIQSYCAHLPYLDVIASVGNALEARAALSNENIDILFLDINMPVMNGISFVKTLKHPPQVIFTTAYKEFAVDAFDLAACDYLLKPFSLERFIVAVDKAVERLQNKPTGHRKILLRHQRIQYLSELMEKSTKYCRTTCYMQRQMAITQRLLQRIIFSCHP